MTTSNEEYVVDLDLEIRNPIDETAFDEYEEYVKIYFYLIIIIATTHKMWSFSIIFRWHTVYSEATSAQNYLMPHERAYQRTKKISTVRQINL